MKLSIVIPVYNEEKTLLELLKRVEDVDLGKITKEIILIDDCSIDGTRDILKSIENKYKIFYQERNQGKGSALKVGFKNATGDLLIIQDADLEYDPKDYPALIEPILNNQADIVYGSRNLTRNRRFKEIYYWGVVFLDTLNNILYKSQLTDTYTCYKLFKAEIIRDLDIVSRGFEFEAEITAKMLKKGYRIKEVPIRYYPRSVEEGKKIRWIDGIKGALALIKYRFKK